MTEEECKSLDLLYKYLKSHFGSPSDPEPASVEEKMKSIDNLLKKYLEHDTIIRRELEIYLKILDLRQCLLKELTDYSDSIKALHKGDLDGKMLLFFLKSVRERLANLLEICGRIKEELKQATSREGETASKLIIYYIKNNHKEMINRLQNTINLFERELKEFNKRINANKVVI